jgi:hypothetical protein
MERELGPFSVEEQIGKHIYILKLSATVRLHNVFHVNNLRPCSTAPLRPVVPVIVPEGDDEEFDVSHIFAVCIKSLHRRRGKCSLFMTHFRDDDIPPVRHRLNEVHRSTALQDFLETPKWHKFAKTHAYIDFMHARPARIPESQQLLQLRRLDHGGMPRGGLEDLSTWGGYECDDYSHVRVHCMTLYMYSLHILIRAFP